jgi:hypothetical protein
VNTSLVEALGFGPKQKNFVKVCVIGATCWTLASVPLWESSPVKTVALATTLLPLAPIM